MRWIEPNQIAIRTTQLDLGIGTTVALVADFHLGVYKDWTFLQRVVDTINDHPEIDYVLVAGDWTFRPEIDVKAMKTLFAPIRDLRVPIIGVLGNHDVEKPWPVLKGELIQALQSLGVVMLNNEVLNMNGWYLLWLWDHDGEDDNVFIINEYLPEEKIVVLTHNPDTTLNYASWLVDLTLVGHTHCGQIRIPFIHDRLAPRIIPVQWPFDCGLTQTKKWPVMITPWLWEVILPMRWFNPPTIDIISF